MTGIEAAAQDEVGFVPHAVKKRKQQEVVKDSKKKKIYFNGYRQYKPLMNAICWGLYKDGRYPLFYKILQNNMETRKDCLACRPLFRVFEGTCKKKWLLKKHLPGQQDKKFKLRREPNAELMDEFSRLLNNLSEDQNAPEERNKATKILLDALIVSEKSSFAERDYFDILISLIKSSLSDYLDRVKSKKQKMRSKKSINSLPAKERVETFFE